MKTLFLLDVKIIKYQTKKGTKSTIKHNIDSESRETLRSISSCSNVDAKCHNFRETNKTK